ncbi:MAG: tetratricopeptide repeat protein [Candidatus Zixiibacteriota bacterium]|nr:MAG: tetratricopeptide repeat protein [candidate division Zixibacteria bacterium]
MSPYWLLIIIAAAVFMIFYVVVFRRRKKSGSTSLEAYIDGLRSIISGDKQRAFVKLRQAVDLDTGNVDAYLKMGDLFREKGMVDKALQLHRELTLRRDITFELSRNVDKSLALDYLAAGARDKAIDLLKPMTKDNGDQRGWAEDKLLDLYVSSEMWNDAEELYSSIMKRKKLKGSKNMANIKIMMGRELQSRKEYHKARLAFKDALSYDRNNPFAYIYIAESYRQENRDDDAVEYLRKLCEEVPRYAYLAFAAIEETFFELGQFGEVENLYRTVLNNDPENVPARIALAGILEKKGEIQEAENMLRSVLDADVSNSAAAIRLAKILAGYGRSREGLEILSDAADKIEVGYDVFKCKYCGETLKRPIPSCPKCKKLGAFL